MSCLLSLFASKCDAMEVHGAVQWLIKAYDDYRHRVINHSISYKVFVEEYLVRLNMPIFLDEGATYNDLLQEATDRDKVKHILENRKFTEEHFTNLTFGEADADSMIAEYNVIGTKKGTNVYLSEELSPISSYPDEAMEGLAKVFQDYQLLSPAISAEDLLLLLESGKPSRRYTIPPYSRNGDLGLVLHILVQAAALSRGWSARICSEGMLLTAAGIKMQAKNLNAAEHRFDRRMLHSLDDREKEIYHATLGVLKKVQSAQINLKNLL